VLEKNYAVESLKDTEKFISENKHLPGIPSAKSLKKDGVNLVALQAKMLERIEVLTVQMIKQNKEIENLNARNQMLEEEIKRLK
jgi:hypothetical protein